MLISLRPVKNLIRSWLSPRQRKTIRRQPTGVRPWLEPLEDRLAPTAALTASDQQLLQSYGQLPISFEVNAGQTNAQVQYLAHGSGYDLFLTSTGAVLNLVNVGTDAAKPGSPPRKELDLRTRGAPTPTPMPTTLTGVALALNLAGANPRASVAGLDQLPGTSNYLIGNDPSQWHTNVTNYGQVAYQGVYPGVNLVYYGNQQQLEYDFVVAPGADPGSIRFAVQGADSVSLDDQGNLVLATGLGDVLEHAPVLYQEVGGARQAVAGQFVLLGQNEVGFQLGAYDASLPLTIDPVLSYSTYLGGSGGNDGYAIAVDGSGNAYVTGSTGSTNFPTTTGAYQTSLGGTSDAFVTKLNATGTGLIYSTYLGGSGADGGNGIAVDGSGDAYVSGQTSSTNFPTTAGAFQTSLAGSLNAFVTKLNSTGTALLYSTYLGGSGSDQGTSIAVDGSGNAYVTGQTSSANFPTTAGALQTIYGGSGNAFVTKLNATGTALIYSTYLGATASDFGNGIAVDSSGNAYVAGPTFSSAFPTTTGVFQTSFGGGGRDAFVAKLNATGTGLIYGTYLGGNGADSALGIAVDSSGNAYVTGPTSSTNFPVTAGAFQTSYGGSFDAYVTKLNATGTALVYSTYLGGSGADDSSGIGGIAVDGAGDACVTGITSSTNFPTTTGAFQTSLSGGLNAFVTKLNATGTALVYSTYLGGSVGENGGQGIAADGSGNVYVTGVTHSTNFPTTAGAYQTSFSGSYDAFVAKFTFVTVPTAQLAVSGFPSTTTAGVAGTVTVTALNADGSTNTGYTGTVQFTSSDHHAVLPPNYTFTTGAGQDNGVHTFSVTLETAGTQSITATDIGNAAMTGGESGILITPAAATHFVLSGPTTVPSGSSFSITVTALDAYGNVATGYTGKVQFTDSLTAATLPANYTFKSSDKGIHAFSGLKLKTRGWQTITVTDTLVVSILGSWTIDVATSRN